MITTEFHIPKRFAIYLKVLVPAYGIDETQVICRLITDFIASNRSELEKNECREKLKILESKLSKINLNEFMDKYGEFFNDE